MKIQTKQGETVELKNGKILNPTSISDKGPFTDYKQLQNKTRKDKPTMAVDQSKAIADFLAKSKSKKIDPKLGGGTVSAATTEAAEQAAKQVEAAHAPEVEAPPRIVEPKTFPLQTCIMGGVTCHVAILSMTDCVDYLGYAYELYEVEDSENLTRKQIEDKVDKRESWQRPVSEKRAKESIVPYLQKELHFFPPLITVPNHTREDIVIDSNSILLPGSSDGLSAPLKALDGQHRLTGIRMLVAETGPDSPFAKETIPVIICEGLSIDQRQQIFADINRQAKTVSKALNILFDHRDQYAQIAMAICNELRDRAQSADDLVDMTRTSPTAKSSNVASLSMVYNLVNNFASSKPDKHNFPLRERMTAQLATDVIVKVIESLPVYDVLKQNKIDYSAAKGAYICYSSTFFQAVGIELKDILISKNVPVEKYVEAAETLIKTTKWETTNPIWKSEGVINDAGKVAVSVVAVKGARSALLNMWGPVSLPGQATQPQTVGTQQ